MPELVMAWLLLSSLGLTLLTLAHGRSIMKPRTFLGLFVAVLAAVGLVVFLLTRPALGKRLDPPGESPFEIHTFSVSGKGGGADCIAIRERQQVMGGSTVALALHCIRRLPRPKAF